MSWFVRIPLLLLGGLIVLVGLAMWSLEDYYGSDAPDFSIVTLAQEGHSTVFAMEGGTRTKVFEGTSSEALAYVHQQREQAGGRSFVTAGVTIAAGGALIVAAIFWPRRAKSKRDATAPAQHANA